MRVEVPGDTMAKQKCRLGQHEDRRMKGGHHIECTKCGDVFPCRHECSHIDCCLATGRKLPDWVKFDLSDVESVMAGILPEGMDVREFLNRGNSDNQQSVTQLKYLTRFEL